MEAAAAEVVGVAVAVVGLVEVWARSAGQVAAEAAAAAVVDVAVAGTKVLVEVCPTSRTLSSDGKAPLRSAKP